MPSSFSLFPILNSFQTQILERKNKFSRVKSQGSNQEISYQVIGVWKGMLTQARNRSCQSDQQQKGHRRQPDHHGRSDHQ